MHIAVVWELGQLLQYGNTSCYRHPHQYTMVKVCFRLEVCLVLPKSALAASESTSVPYSKSLGTERSSDQGRFSPLKILRNPPQATLIYAKVIR